MHAKGMGFLPRAEGFCSLNAALCRPGKDNIQDPTSNIQRRSKLQVPNGAIKSVGHSNMECGGKRSATPLWLVFVPYPSPDEPLSPKAASRFACHRVPPHAISCRSVTDCSNHPSHLPRLNAPRPLFIGSCCFSARW